MLRAEAARRLRKLFGKHMYFRVYDGISSPENRALALETERGYRRQMEEISRQMDELRKRLLADPEYRSLMAAYNELKAAHDKRSGGSTFYRFEAGTLHGVGGMNWFRVECHGDTWEELFEDYAAKNKKAG
jgi:hypothetical protein